VGVTKLPSGKLTIGKEIGRGNFGEVYEGYWEGRKIALKKMSLTSSIEPLHREVTRLSTLDHSNIVSFYGIYQHEPEDYTYMVMEFCEGGNLQTVLEKQKTISWSKTWQWAIEISSAVSYLHSEGVLHRDLKAENILLDPHRRARLADWDSLKWIFF